MGKVGGNKKRQWQGDRERGERGGGEKKLPRVYPRREEAL